MDRLILVVTQTALVGHKPHTRHEYGVEICGKKEVGRSGRAIRGERSQYIHFCNR